MIYLNLDCPIEKSGLGLSIRCYNGLIKAEIKTVADLVECDRAKLWEIQHLGTTSIRKITDFIESIKSCSQNSDIFPSDKLSEISIEKFPLLFRNANGILCYDVLLENLDLSVRSCNILKRSGYNLASQLIDVAEAHLMTVRNCGRNSIYEIMSKIKSLNFTEAPINEIPIKENILCKTFVSEIVNLFP